jgi:hypothetical protein
MQLIGSAKQIKSINGFPVINQGYNIDINSNRNKKDRVYASFFDNNKIVTTKDSLEGFFSNLYNYDNMNSLNGHCGTNVTLLDLLEKDRNYVNQLTQPVLVTHNLSNHNFTQTKSNKKKKKIRMSRKKPRRRFSRRKR